MSTKTCAACGAPKPLDDFPLEPRNKTDGHNARCRDCERERKRQQAKAQRTRRKLAREALLATSPSRKVGAQKGGSVPAGKTLKLSTVVCKRPNCGKLVPQRAANEGEPYCSNVCYWEDNGGSPWSNDEEAAA